MLRLFFQSTRPAAFSAALAIGLSAPVEAQKAPDFANMETRIGQLVEILKGSESCSAVEAALDLTLGLVYGGTRPLPSKIPANLDEARELFGNGIDEQDLVIARRAEGVNEVINGTVGPVVDALRDLAQGHRCPTLGGMATDLKFHLEEIEDVAAAVSEYTARCGVGDSLVDGFCAQLRPVLDEETGHLIPPDDKAVPQSLRRGFFLKLRSPFIPRYSRLWEEDVKLIPPLDDGQCSAVFKETKGLMLRLRLDGFTVVRDPWATPTLPRGTKIPIWTLEWVPSEYVKHFNVCNRDGKVEGSVTQRVKQDVPLNFFWRYYPKTP